MSYIEQELTEGERIVLLGRVSWWTVIPRTLLALGLLVVAGVLAAMLSVLAPLFWVIAVPLVGVVWIALVARQVLRVLSTEIAITDRRVMSKSGIFRTDVKTTPLDKVNNINVVQSLFGNMLDYGNIEITTATAEERDNHFIAALAHPDRFRNTLTEVTQGSSGSRGGL